MPHHCIPLEISTAMCDGTETWCGFHCTYACLIALSTPLHYYMVHSIVVYSKRHLALESFNQSNLMVTIADMWLLTMVLEQ